MPHANARAAALIAIAIAVTVIVGVLVMVGAFLGVVVEVMAESFGHDEIIREARRPKQGIAAPLERFRCASVAFVRRGCASPRRRPRPNFARTLHVFTRNLDPGLRRDDYPYAWPDESGPTASRPRRDTSMDAPSTRASCSREPRAERACSRSCRSRATTGCTRQRSPTCGDRSCCARARRAAAAKRDTARRIRDAKTTPSWSG